MLVSLYIYIYIYSINIPSIMIMNKTYEQQDLLSLYLVSFLAGLRIYQHPCTCISTKIFILVTYVEIRRIHLFGTQDNVLCYVVSLVIPGEKLE